MEMWLCCFVYGAAKSVEKEQVIEKQEFNREKWRKNHSRERSKAWMQQRQETHVYLSRHNNTVVTIRSDRDRHVGEAFV